jgi:hypothetical protein
MEIYSYEKFFLNNKIHCKSSYYVEKHNGVMELMNQIMVGIKLLRLVNSIHLFGKMGSVNLVSKYKRDQ